VEHQGRQDLQHWMAQFYLGEHCTLLCEVELATVTAKEKTVLESFELHLVNKIIMLQFIVGMAQTQDPLFQLSTLMVCSELTKQHSTRWPLTGMS
jgi:hypothetical protein